MGADFCCWIIEHKKSIKLNWAKGKEYVKKHKRAIEAQDISIEEINGHIERLKNAYEYQGDCALFQNRGYIMLITGGMSWGDCPTDTATAISVLQEVNINNANISILGAIGFKE